MTVAKKGPSVDKKWFEEFFLLLQPEKPYTTGEIIRFWIECESIPHDQKEKMRKTKNSVQTTLGKYVSKRFEYERRRAETDGPLEYAMVYEPIGRTPFQPTNFKQKIYLGAQYAWVAANHLGLEQPRSLDEVLRLRRIAMDEELPDLENAAKSSDVVVGNSGEVVQPAVTPRATVEATVDSSLTVDALNENQGEAGLIEHVPVKKRSLRKRFRRWRVPVAFAMSVFSTFVCLATIGGVILYQNYPELERMEIAQNTGGTTAVKDVTKTFKDSGNKAEVYGAGWRAAYDPLKNIDEIKAIVEPLLYDEKLGWQAKANHVVGLAYLNRGDLNFALENFEEAETKLRGLSKQRLDLKKIYLNMADCYFYLNQPEKMLECIKLARMLKVSGREAVTYHYESQYYFLQGETHKAISLSHKALRLSKTTETSYSGYYHANLGLLYSATGKMDQSYKHLKEAHAFAVLNKDNSLLSVIYEYERFWAEKMNFPFSGISSINNEKSFSSEENYISFSVDLARESSASKPRRQ